MTVRNLRLRSFLNCSPEVSITAVSEKKSTSWFHKFLTPIPLIQTPSKNHQSIPKNSYKSATDPTVCNLCLGVCCLHPAREYFTDTETSPMTEQGCKNPSSAPKSYEPWGCLSRYTNWDMRPKFL